MKKKAVSFCIILFCLSLLWDTSPAIANDIKTQAYRKLDSIRSEKKTQLDNYLQIIRSKTDAIQRDEMMINFFMLKRQYVHLKEIAPPPDRFVRHMEVLKNNIQSHYLWNYLSFYDILFVDKNGDVFYSVRKKKNYGINLFIGEMAKTALSQRLRKRPDKTFVDYQYYHFFKEPSAFFVVPVKNKNRFEGWLVLQCAINKINDMFSRKPSLGVTGEVFLVNRECYMLTDSRFYGESSILTKHLSKENIQTKFKEGSGNKIVVDYRGRKALTSFEVCNIGGAKWLLIAKIDEDEVVTRHYKISGNKLKSDLLKSICIHKSSDCTSFEIGSEEIDVDMDEFRKARQDQVLRTYGVSTCTALVISLPGSFSYMAHISNLDRIYGNKTTDLIGRIIDQLEMFDILKCQKLLLQVTLIANHTEAIIPAVDILVERGIFLSQIKFMRKIDAKYASPIHDCKSGETAVDWIMDRKTGHVVRQCDGDMPDLGCFFKKIINYDGI